MYIKEDLSFEDLKERCWSGAVSTLETIEEAGKEEELMDCLQELFNASGNEVPTITDINDFLWFDEELLNNLGINEEAENEDIEDEEEM